MKLTGTADSFLNTHLKLHEEITYDRLKAILIERDLRKSIQRLSMICTISNGWTEEEWESRRIREYIKSLNE